MNSCFQTSCWLQTLMHLSAQLFDNGKVSLKFFFVLQDDVRLRLFLDSIGFSNLSAKKIKKWTPEDRKRFELVQEK